MRSGRSCLAAAVAAAVVVLLGSGTAAATPPPAAAGEFAPLDQQGPRLGVPKAQLDAGLSCNGPLRRSAQDPVLLVPGTTLTPEVNFGRTYMRAFDQLGLRWCAVTLPSDATGDIQIAAEYVDVIGLSPSNHGTVVADAACQRECTPANHQQASQSAFMAALNSGTETFAGIDYTVAYTATDEIVVPNTPPNASSALRTGQGRIANIALQEVCPTNTADHFAIGSYDPVGYAIVTDALAHDGPAVRERIPLATCLRTTQPGVDRATFLPDFTGMVRYAGNSEGDAAKTPDEPPLGPYVVARR
ncbi:lipase [Blastococcus capsensis]|uniref:lipase n=1 Tax=Blastococcus capsensis TaxID=1564163 RepID=UPI002541692A|nr:lipase [Blastococcus capsensis]MDK3258114.1 lipase [Blastococcus capsensis]